MAVAASASAATPPKPVLSTRAAFGITYQQALLTGTVNPEGRPTFYFFQIGTSKTYGSGTAPVYAGSGSHTLSVSATVAGLSPVTTYHYRIVADGASGAFYGSDRTFVSGKIPLSLAIAAVPNPVPLGGTFTIEGTLSGTGNGGRAVVLQQNAFPYLTNNFVDVGNAQLTLPDGGFDFTVLNATLNSQYRVVSVDRTPVMSGVVVENVALHVTLRTQRSRRHRHRVRLFGAIAPAQNGAGVSIQRLGRRGWVTVAGTIARPAGTLSRFSDMITVPRPGTYQVLVTATDGSHVAGTSNAVGIA